MNKVDIKKLDDRLSMIERQITEIRSLVGPFGMLLADGSALVQTLHGIKYFIDPNDLIMAPQLIVYRQWEADLSAFFINSINQDTVFVDVGANFGYFTCLIASKIGCAGKGQVFSFEPNPLMIGLLKKNVQVNWSMAPITVFENAVSNTVGFVQFNVPKNRAANASIVNNNSKTSDETSRFIVPTNTLDNMLSDIVVDVMKVDVEGFEMFVIDGAQDLIARSPNICIVMEWSLKQMISAGIEISLFIQKISELGLSAYRIPGKLNISTKEWNSVAIDLDTLLSLDYDNIILRRST